VGRLLTAGFAHGITVTVKRPTSTGDRWGDKTSPPVDHQVHGCAVYPRGSGNAAREQLDARETITEGLVLLAPFGSDIKATDEVVLPNGQRYRVDGEPGSWQSPFTGWQPGMELALKDVTG
jgi:hypothetical protein